MANLPMLLGCSDFISVDSWALKLVSHEWHGGEQVRRAEVEAALALGGVEGARVLVVGLVVRG